ncbi:thioredoxin family protein [Flaviaesturariibacter amylovorans]|uniref:Thioredoxin domain-containing protein n=1 Tax=Flaviaesturariibacter amylovorans TaxID=1084520 RepID=A0ABP8GDJ8_9BACT
MRPARLLLVFLLLVSTAAGAAGIDFVHGKAWKDVLTEAKAQNKIIFLDAYTTWCGPCKYLQQNVFTDAGVGTFYNKSFINVKIDMEAGEGPALAEQLGVSAYPTLFFINGDGEVLHKKVGATDVAGFLDLGSDAVNPDKQFYTVKKKAAAGSLDPAAFHQWVHDAEAFGETGLDDLIASNLARFGGNTGDKDVLELMLDHAVLDAKALTLLQRNKAGYAKLLGRTPAGYDAALQNRVMRYALVKATAADSVNYAIFRSATAAYFPADALRLTSKVRMTAYANDGDAKKSLDELRRIITVPGMNLRAEELSSLIVNQFKALMQSGRAKEFIGLIKTWKLPAADAANAYHKDFALLVLHYINSDKKSITPLADKILKDARASEEIKGMTRKIAERG